MLVDVGNERSRINLLQQAESLLNEGHYEKALTKYYEGQKLRPNHQPFQLGIKRCHDAIQADIDIGIQTLKARRGEGFISPLKQQKKAPLLEIQSDHEHMTLLRQTKEYINFLADEPHGVNNRKNDFLQKIAQKEEGYLMQRTVFWRQLLHLQNATERLRQVPITHTNTDYLYKFMSKIAQDLRTEKYSVALKKCIQHRKAMRGQSDLLLIATYLGFLGTAYTGLRQDDKAIECFKEELHVARMSKEKSLLSKALEHLADTYNNLTTYNRALPLWKERIKLPHTHEEASWIYHQIAQCHLGMGNPRKALASAEKAHTFSLEAKEPFWQVNADVLLGQAQVLLGDLGPASETLERALEIAKLQDYEEAIATISKNLKIANEYIVLKVKKKAGEDPSRPFSLPTPYTEQVE